MICYIDVNIIENIVVDKYGYISELLLNYKLLLLCYIVLDEKYVNYNLIRKSLEN